MSDQINSNLTNVNSESYSGGIVGRGYNKGNVPVEELDLSLDSGSISSSDIDLNRISISSDRALNEEFVKVNKDVFNNGNLTYEKRSDGTYLIRDDGEAIGFTDIIGINENIVDEQTTFSHDTKTNLNAPIIEGITGLNVPHNFNKNSDLINSMSDDIKNVISTSTGAVFDENKGFFDKFLNEAKLFKEELIDNASKVGATITTGAISVIEGSGLAGESFVDAGAIIGTVASSIITGLVDGVGYAINGDNWDSLTKYMWDNTMDYVKEERMSDSMDFIYDSIDFGKALKDNTYGFDTTRAVGNGIGYTAGIIGTSTLSMGLSEVATGTTISTTTANYAMAGYAGAAGFGGGAEEAWNNGADAFEGIVAGGLTGALDAGQFLIGGKIKGLTPFSDDIANSAVRMGLSGLDATLDSFVDPAIETIYKDTYMDDAGNYVKYSGGESIWSRYTDAFDEQGGFKNVGANFALGVGVSGVNEYINMKSPSTGVHDLFDVADDAMDNFFEKAVDEVIEVSNKKDK